VASRTAQYLCAGCDEEADGIWPWPDAGDEQDQDGAPVAEQECPCGHRQAEQYPGYAFFGEAG
jgi:hypothetical protein